MVARVSTVAFLGIKAVPVDVQVHISSGMVAFTVVGLPDKAVAESRERVRAALSACGLALPAKRITVNLAPADLPKEGSHFDLPIAVGLLSAMGLIPQDILARYFVLGELALDGSFTAVSGALPVAVAANERQMGLICLRHCGPESAWASEDMDIIAHDNLFQLLIHILIRAEHDGKYLLNSPYAKNKRARRHQMHTLSRCRDRQSTAHDGSPGRGKVDALSAAALDPPADGPRGNA